MLYATGQESPSLHAFRVPSQNIEKRLLASSCLSVRIKQLGSQWTSQEILYDELFFKDLTRKFKILCFIDLASWYDPCK